MRKIKRIRIEKGFSQTTIAKEIGLSQPGYANLENGETKNIPLSIAVRISKVLGVSFNELFDIDGDNNKVNLLETEIDLLRKRIAELERIIDLQKIEKRSIKQDFAYYLHEQLKKELFPIGLQIKEELDPKKQRKLFLKWNEINHKFHDTVLSPLFKNELLSKKEYDQIAYSDGPLFTFLANPGVEEKP